MGEDPIEDALGAIASDAFPAIAATTEGRADLRSLAIQLQMELSTGPQRQVYEAITNHPSHQACLSAISADTQLRILAADAAGMQPFLMSSKGGSRMGADSLPLAIISAAATEASFSSEGLTADTLRNAALANLALVRRAIAGESVNVVSLVGYGGVSLAAGQTVQTPWGQIRPISAPGWLLPESPTPVGFGLAGVRAQATAVLVATSRERVSVSHEAQPTMPSLEEIMPEVERSQRIALELVPLSLILATAGDDPLRPVPLWQMPVMPWTAGRSWSSWTFPYNLRQRVRPLEPSDLADIELWAKLVDDHQHDELAFVGRRIVSATSSRSALDDVLVDAVIAWENLVGGAPETTFRTSAAMACLLEQEPESRITLQRRLAAIYGARSDVVHGRLGRDMGQWKWRLAKGTEKVGLDIVANEALDVAVRGLKTIMATRSDLIALNAAGRCERLLMGA